MDFWIGTVFEGDFVCSVPVWPRLYVGRAADAC